MQTDCCSRTEQLLYDLMLTPCHNFTIFICIRVCEGKQHPWSQEAQQKAPRYSCHHFYPYRKFLHCVHFTFFWSTLKQALSLLQIQYSTVQYKQYFSFVTCPVSLQKKCLLPYCKQFQLPSLYMLYHQMQDCIS